MIIKIESFIITEFMFCAAKIFFEVSGVCIFTFFLGSEIGLSILFL